MQDAVWCGVQENLTFDRYVVAYSTMRRQKKNNNERTCDLCVVTYSKVLCDSHLTTYQNDVP